MKKFTVLFMLLNVAFLAAQGMKFEEGTTFQKVLEKAKKENKVIFMDAYTTWCGPCKLMAKNIFPQTAVGEFYNSNFINTKFDMEKGEGIAIAKKYGVKAFPTYLFIDGNGEIVYRGTGYYGQEDFIKIGKEAADPSKQISVLKKKFDEGEKSQEFLKNIIKVFAYSDTELTSKAALRYYEVYKTEPITPEDLSYLMALTKDSNSPLYKVIVERKQDFLKFGSGTVYNSILKKYQLASVLNSSYDKEKKMLNEAKFLGEAKKQMSDSEAQQFLLKTKVSLAKSEKNYANLAKYAAEYYQDGAAEKYSADELNEIAWTYFENVNDAAALKQAVKWAEQSVKKNEQSFNTDTLANLYYKTGDKQNAKIWAEKSIELAKKTGQDYQSTQELLDKVK